MKRTPLLLVVAALLALVLILRVVWTNDEIPDTGRIRVIGVSLATGKDVDFEVSKTETSPFACPETGERCVFPWYFDKSNGKRFVPPPVKRADGSWGMPTIPINPNTGATGSMWMPPLHQDQHKGDEPLPAWPPK